MKKILAIAIILLFIGVAVAPSINQSVVKASTDDDLVEVTSQACGIQGYGDTTVKLTREQYNELEEYLVEFSSCFNKTTKRAETIPLLNKAIVEFNKYGLLPRGMNIKQAQKLVTEQYQDKKILGLQNQYMEYHSLLFDNLNNSDCSIVGQGSPVYFFNRLGINIILYLQKNTRFRGSLFFEIVRNQRSRINCYVELGHYARESDNGIYAPYNGYLNTVGSNGNQSWNGPLYGMIVNFILSAWYMSETYFIGIKNFKGFAISRNESKYFFGIASYVEIHLGQFPNSPY